VTTDDVIETDAIVSSDEGGETGSDGSGCSAGASSRASGLALVLLLIPMAAFGLRRRFN